MIGIDLGTTYSAAAFMDFDGPRLIPNALGDTLTPSVVGIDLEGRLLVGRAAKELAVLHPERCAAVFKRHMGTEWKTTLVKQEFTPEKLSSLVLQSLKQDAETHLGEPVTDAVITVPAYFNEHQRRSTMLAGKIAGLNVPRILNEPTAAALAYGFHEIQEEKILLVFDLGGGTFDVSIVELFEGTIEVRASSGDSLLGGEDFTGAMAVRILESRGMVFERTELHHPLLVSRLRQQCELAKRRLSSEAAARVRVPNEQGELSEGAPVCEVTREQFELWTERILRRVDLPLRRALGDAGLKVDQIDDVLLVGGATRMPAVVARLRDVFQKEPQNRLNPDEVVALGAAVQAGLIDRNAAVEDMVVTDVAPFTLGIDVCKEFGVEARPGYFLPIIHRNTTIPISRVQRICTISPNQTRMKIEVYQGEHRRVEHNLLLGEFVVEGIPKGPPGQPVDVRFTYDLNGVLEVEATILETRKSFTHVIARHARGMSADQVHQAVREMQKLKRHPRDDEPNRLLLHRAERLYTELALAEQRQLEQILDGFEESLELNDKEAIDRYREALQFFLDEHDNEGEGL